MRKESRNAIISEIKSSPSLPTSSSNPIDFLNLTVVDVEETRCNDPKATGRTLITRK